MEVVHPGIQFQVHGHSHGPRGYSHVKKNAREFHVKANHGFSDFCLLCYEEESAYLSARAFNPRLKWKRCDVHKAPIFDQYRIHLSGMSHYVPIAQERSLPSVFKPGLPNRPKSIKLDSSSQQDRHMQKIREVYQNRLEKRKTVGQTYPQRINYGYNVCGKKAQIVPKFNIDARELEEILALYPNLDVESRLTSHDLLRHPEQYRYETETIDETNDDGTINNTLESIPDGDQSFGFSTNTFSLREDIASPPPQTISSRKTPNTRRPSPVQVRMKDKTLSWQKDWDPLTATGKPKSEINAARKKKKERIDSAKKERAAKNAKKWGLSTKQPKEDPYAHLYQPKLEQSFIDLKISSEEDVNTDAFATEYDPHAELKEWRMNLVSPLQYSCFSEMFDRIDIDHSGTITLHELIRKSFNHVPQKDIRQLIEVFDLNGDQQLDKREFVVLCGLNDRICGTVNTDPDAHLQLNLDVLQRNLMLYAEVFRLIDQDGDEKIHVEEVMVMIHSALDVSMEMNEAVTKYILDSIDKDEHGFIDFISFLTCLPFFLYLHKALMDRSNLDLRRIQQGRDDVRARLRQKRLANVRVKMPKQY